MAHEFQMDIALNQDRIKKGTTDKTIKGRLQIVAGNKTNIQKKEKVNLVFVLDSSGSMRDPYYQTGKDKREIVFESVNNLLNQIDVSDTVSIISFNTQAIVHCDHIPGVAKTAIQEALKLYKNDNGQTNFEAAMKMTLALCKTKIAENHKCIFLTDGNSYSGDDKEAFKICQEMASLGVTVDAMGIGEAFNFNFMKKFSDMSGSLTENIIQVNQVRSIFNQIYTSSTNVFLKKVFINLFFTEKIRDVHFYMHQPEQKNYSEYINRSSRGTSVQINAGDVEQNGIKEFLFDFTFDAPNQASIKVADAKITYDCPSEKIANSTIDQAIYINLSDNDDSIYDSTIEIAYADIELLQMQNNVIKLSEQKKFKEAGVILEEMALIAESLNDHDKAKVYREQKNKIMRDEQLTLADLNMISSTSSRATIKTHTKAESANKRPKKRLT